MRSITNRPIIACEITFYSKCSIHTVVTDSGGKQDRHPSHRCCHTDVLTLTCCWGSGTSPPFWSWGHLRSLLRSHKEPQTESLLKENKDWHVVVRLNRGEWYSWNVMMFFMVYLFICVTHGQLVMQWQQDILCSPSVALFWKLYFISVFHIQNEICTEKSTRSFYFYYFQANSKIPSTRHGWVLIKRWSLLDGEMYSRIKNKSSCHWTAFFGKTAHCGVMGSTFRKREQSSWHQSKRSCIFKILSKRVWSSLPHHGNTFALFSTMSYRFGCQMCLVDHWQKFRSLCFPLTKKMNLS